MITVNEIGTQKAGWKHYNARYLVIDALKMLATVMT